MAIETTITPSSGEEEGVVKMLIRGLVRTGGIYADARMAADQETNPERREMREFAAEQAKSALLEDIAAANVYIEVLKGKIEESRNGSHAAAEPADETESVKEMFGLTKGTADAISALLFSGPRNTIEPNQTLNRRNLEKIALLLDTLDIDEAELKARTEAFLRHKGFDDDAIIEETVESVLTLWQDYQQDEAAS